jgi:hypothetical protein
VHTGGGFFLKELDTWPGHGLRRRQLLCVSDKYSGCFPSGWGRFCSFQPPLEVYTQHKLENAHINFEFLSSAAPSVSYMDLFPALACGPFMQLLGPNVAKEAKIFCLVGTIKLLYFKLAATFRGLQ